MSRRPNPEDDVEALLFDLPLHRQAAPTGSAPQPKESEAESTATTGAEAEDEPFGLLPEEPEPETTVVGPAESPPAATESSGPRSEDVEEGPEPVTEGVKAPTISFAMTLPFDGEAEEETATDRRKPAGASEPVPAGLAALLLAGLLDLGLIFAGMVTAVLGAAALGSAPGLDDWPALTVLGLALSLPYYVVPMAFWGRSAGMAAFSLFCRSSDGGSLSFRQAVIRWFAALLTVATLGLGLLIALTGRSLADRLSGTHTLTHHA